MEYLLFHSDRGTTGAVALFPLMGEILMFEGTQRPATGQGLARWLQGFDIFFYGGIEWIFYLLFHSNRSRTGDVALFPLPHRRYFDVWGISPPCHGPGVSPMISSI